MVLALTHQAARRLAEIGFLLILFAGVWLVAAEIPFRIAKTRRALAGAALAAAGVLLIIATHGGFGG
jgi:hypothetical protein